MMNDKSFNSLIILVCGLCALAASGVYAQNPQTEELRKELNKVAKIFESKRVRLADPDEILGNLKRYIEIGTQLNDLGQSPMDFDEQVLLQDYESLVELTDIDNFNQDRCNAETFALLRAYKDYIGTQSNTIRYYLNQFGSKLFTICSDVFRSNLIHAVHKLTRDEIKDIDRLAKEITKGHTSDGTDILAPIDVKHIALGSIYFMEVLHDVKITREATREELEQYWIILMDFVCNGVEIHLRDPLSVYYELISDTSVSYNIDFKVHEWIIKDKICRSMRSNKEEIVDRWHHFVLHRVNRRERKSFDS